MIQTSPERDRIADASIVASDRDADRLSIAWASGLQETFLVIGEPGEVRDRVELSREDGLKLLDTLSGSEAWRREGRYQMRTAEHLQMVQLPDIRFEWHDGAEAG